MELKRINVNGCLAAYGKGIQLSTKFRDNKQTMLIQNLNGT